MTTLAIDSKTSASYRLFLQAKGLPSYKVQGRTITIPDEYAGMMGLTAKVKHDRSYEPIGGLFDYQRDITALAIKKRKFAVFADCGLGKSLMLLEFARHARASMGGRKRTLIVTPLMVIPQMIGEVKRFYGDSLPVVQVRAAGLAAWMNGDGEEIGITNYEALTEDVPQGRLGCLILDESSMLKSHYGKWGQTCLRLGCGLDWKLCLTGTPAPNDRIEYANHAVFLDAFPSVNSFLARYFVNRGQTNERWEMKSHAIRPFYRALSHWCVFLTNPATYGWKDNTQTIPPIHVHIHDVDMSAAQNTQARELTGTMFANHVGGIGSRAKLARIAKTGDTLKPAFIRGLVESWPDESTLIWCRFNDEQERLAAEMPVAASITGATPIDDRMRIIDDFKAGRVKTIITKAKIMGFGLNLQIATRQIFSSLHDSYEEYYQAVKRSNRVGSVRPLNVHVPVTEIERPMVETVLRKAGRVLLDTEQQEELFRDSTGLHAASVGR